MKKSILNVVLSMSLLGLRAIFITCLFSGVLLANNTTAQSKSIHKVFISLTLEGAPIKAALRSIEEKTEFKFGYEQSVLLDTDYKITLEVDNESVAKTLKIIANQTNLVFKQMNGMIIVNVRSQLKRSSIKEAESLDQIISGKVTDENGNPIAGVSVLVQGTTIGVVTDIDGNYRLSAPDHATILVFSYVGYKHKEVEINGRAEIDISLSFDITTLGEVVVSTGYWETNERLNPGNIGKITSEEIETQPVANPIQTLQGRVPGVTIQQTSGLPGGGFNIQIRGLNSLRRGLNDNGNLPFFVIDGVPYPNQSLASRVSGSILNFGNPLNSINASDIESIEILKDADATSIYGSRGANGVVLITTKRGKPGKTRFDINMYQGAGKVTNMMELLNTEQYLEMRNEAFSNDGVTPDPTNPQHFDVTRWGEDYTDWQEVLIGGTANITNAQASVSGGDANTQFTFGTGYYRETTVLPGDFSYQKGSGRFHLNHISRDKKFNISLTTNFVADKNDLSSSDPTQQALHLPPNHPTLLDEEGNFVWVEGDFSAQNPLAAMSGEFIAKTNNLTSSVDLGYRIGADLHLKTRLGYNRVQLDETLTTPTTVFNAAFGVTSGSSRFVAANTNSWVIEPQIEYRKDLFNGKLNVLIGSTFQENILEREATFAGGFQDDNSLKNIAAASSLSNFEYVYNQYRYNAVFARINYNWKDKYILNLTGRRDGSSRFGRDRQFGNFGAVGTAWIFSNEEFVKQGLSFLSFGKLKASYGTTGSDQIGDYGYLDSYQYVGNSYLGIPGIQPSRLANPDYGWETNKKLETGLELGFYDDRILVSASYYRNRSSSQLVGFSLPTITGFSSIQGNLNATVENKGWELEFSTTNLNTEKLRWTTSFNLTIPQNKLVEYPDIENSSFANIYEVGKSLFAIKVFQNTVVNPQTGIYTFEDLNGDGNISANEDRLFTEELSQEFFGGFQNNIRYKGFELDIFFQFVKQTGGSYLQNFRPPGFNSNQPTEVLDRWQNPGDITEIQMFSQGFSPATFAWINVAFSSSDITVVDASFIRLKNISLAWNFPNKWIERVKLKNGKIYLLGQNLLTITDYVGLDPETRGTSLPPLRVITGGIQVTF